MRRRRSRSRMLSRIINGSVDGTQLHGGGACRASSAWTPGRCSQLYLLYTSRHGDTSGWTLSVQQFVDFLCQEVLPDARFAAQLSGVDTSQLQSARTVIDAVASGPALHGGGAGKPASAACRARWTAARWSCCSSTMRA